MQKPYKAKIDLYDNHSKNTRINYVVFDNKTMPLYIDLFAYGKPFELPTTAVVELNFTDSMGVSFPRYANIINHKDGQILYNIDRDDISINGNMSCTVSIVNLDDERITFPAFNFRVTESAADMIISDDNVPWFNQIMVELSLINQRLDEIGAGGGTGEGTTYHNLLKNLTYELSGHTGFASAEQINAINAEITNINSKINALVLNDSALADEIIDLRKTISDIQLIPGPPGADGQAATIAIGTTTTTAPGTNATVTNTGTSSNAILNFGIPRGQDGTSGQGGSTPIIDNLTSTSTTSALSANQGRVLNTSKEPVIPTKNTAFNKNFGTAAGTVCEGNDSRLSDSRTPLPHNHSAADINSGTMSPARISQDSSNRFVTDTEKTTWNNKASTAIATQSANGLMSSSDKTKLDGIETGANKTIVENTVTSTSTVNAASSNSVKTAYDLANIGNNRAINLENTAVTSEIFDDGIIDVDIPDFDPVDVLARITKLENTVGTLTDILGDRRRGIV